MDSFIYLIRTCLLQLDCIVQHYDWVKLYRFLEGLRVTNRRSGVLMVKIETGISCKCSSVTPLEPMFHVRNSYLQGICTFFPFKCHVILSALTLSLTGPLKHTENSIHVVSSFYSRYILRHPLRGWLVRFKWAKPDPDAKFMGSTWEQCLIVLVPIKDGALPKLIRLILNSSRKELRYTGKEQIHVSVSMNCIHGGHIYVGYQLYELCNANFPGHLWYIPMQTFTYITLCCLGKLTLGLYVRRFSWIQRLQFCVILALLYRTLTKDTVSFWAICEHLEQLGSSRPASYSKVCMFASKKQITLIITEPAYRGPLLAFISFKFHTHEDTSSAVLSPVSYIHQSLPDPDVLSQFTKENCAKCANYTTESICSTKYNHSQVIAYNEVLRLT